MPGNVFINYRRQSDSGMAGRIYDNLSRALPGVSIFMDVDRLNPGDDFEDGLQKSLADCAVFLAIIGPQWAAITDQTGQQRLSNPDDFVRHELRTALEKNLRVIPVLIGGAQMPSAAALPTDLVGLTKRQAMEIRHERFRADIDALAQAIKTTARPTRFRLGRRPAIAASVLALAAAAGSLYSILRPSGLNWTDWLDQEEYQRVFDEQVKKHWYPKMIEAAAQGDFVQYRAVFEPFPPRKFEFSARHSINDDEFRQFDAKMAGEGFQRVFQQRMVVHSQVFNQGVWTKT